jgi:hypothetical protein
MKMPSEEDGSLALKPKQEEHVEVAKRLSALSDHLLRLDSGSGEGMLTGHAAAMLRADADPAKD